MKTITAHQALFGDVKRGHQLISASNIDDRNLLDKLTAGYTDLHYNFDWCGLESFLRGGVVESHYVLTRIAPDVKVRAGLVLAYSLIFPLEEMLEWNNLLQLLSVLADPPPKNALLEPKIFVEIDEVGYAKPLGLTKLINSLVKNSTSESRPLVWVGESGFREALQGLWEGLWPAARRSISFDASSNPADIRGNPTILLVSENCAQRWHNFDLIRASDYCEPSSLAEQVLLGNASGAELWTLQQDLELLHTDLSELLLVERLHQFLVDFEHTSNFPILVQAARIVARLAPNPQLGIFRKTQLMHEVSKRLQSTQVRDLLVLRNLRIDAFGESAKSLILDLRNRLSHYFSEYSPNVVSEFIDVVLSVVETNQPYWNEAVQQFLNDYLSRATNPKHGSFVWLAWVADVRMIEVLDRVLPNSTYLEEVLTSSTPSEIERSIGNQVCTLALKRRWLKLHASVVSRCYDLSTALSLQLAQDTDQQYIIGIKTVVAYFQTKLGDRDVVLTLLADELIDKRINSIAGDICVRDPEILLDLPPVEMRSRQLWHYCLQSNSNLLADLFVPDEFIYSILDSALVGDSISVAITEYIGRSRYANILNYTRRNEVWSKLNRIRSISFFESATASAWLENFLQGQLSDSDLTPELPLQNAIKQSNDLRKFLLSDWVSVCTYAIRIFTQLRQVLGEHNFIGLVLDPQLYKRVPESEAREIGRFIRQNYWRDAAMMVHKVVRIYDGKTPWSVALDEVDGLIEKPKKFMDDLVQGVRQTFSWDDERPRMYDTHSNRRKRIKVLVVLADPSSNLNLSEEAKFIEQGLGDFERCELRISLNTQIEDLQRYLQSYRPHIVHFSGHGSEVGELLFLNENRQAVRVAPQALANLFALLKNDIRCVVLNACYSETQAKSISTTVDYVVGMSDRIRDSAAIEFTKAFYQSLASQEDYELAFNIGCNRIDLKSKPGSDVPVLLKRTH